MKHYIYDMGMSDFQMGLDAGLGFRYSLAPKTAIRTKFDFEHNFRFFGTYIEDKSYNNNVYFEASVFYRFK